MGTSRIRDIEFMGLEFVLPADQAYGMAKAAIARRQVSLVRVITEDGTTGVGEAFGAAGVTAAYLDLLRGYFLGQDLFDNTLIRNRIFARHYHLGLENQLVTCLGAIDVAIFDAMGKVLGLPVCKLLGGRARDHLAAYASDGYFTDDPQNQLGDQLAGLKGQGFRGVKIKVGRGAAEDEARVRLCREVVGDEVLLLVDANTSYTPAQALESMVRIAPYDIHWYEEPLMPRDVAGLKWLHDRAPMPIATGEALYTVHGFRPLLDSGCLDVAMPDIAICGGLSEVRAIADLCALHGVRLSPHVWGSGVGLAAAVHMLAALPDHPHAWPQPCLLEYDVGENALRDEILQQPLALDNGLMAVPEGPGLGIELDEAALVRYAVDSDHAANWFS
ncbi:MAG: mandelate racemase/muconate lactonizing enzyme family protein [Alphaproteobacteria bacterium]|nr:mandelate racemase/muconate lactonizing enzyme family protein [Alphaproteobacteria bacterium]MDP6621516.1 mandelate racemase/muconate lactonizing enzyme family protein [Alphaproteobacteria bacterium]